MIHVHVEVVKNIKTAVAEWHKCYKDMLEVKKLRAYL